jgi:N utilization substance protein B
MSEVAPARSRRAAREVALRAVYSRLTGQEELEEAMVGAIADLPLAPESQEFAWRIAEGIWHNQRELEDLFIPFLAKGWSIDRLAITDRAVLNLATWELYHLEGVPPKVTIAEALRLSKRYGSGEGTRFVNAVLGRVLAGSPKANWDPALEEILDPEPVDPDVDEPEEMIQEGTPEHDEFVKATPWVIRTDG